MNGAQRAACASLAAQGPAEKARAIRLLLEGGTGLGRTALLVNGHEDEVRTIAFDLGLVDEPVLVAVRRQVQDRPRSVGRDRRFRAPWTEEEEAVLISRELTLAQFFERFPERTASSVRNWRESHVEECALDDESLALAIKKRVPGMTVQQLATDLGVPMARISRTSRTAGIDLTFAFAKVWTREQDDLIMEDLTASPEKLSAILDRTPNAVSQRRSKLRRRRGV